MPPLQFPRGGRTEFTPAEMLAINTPGVVNSEKLADDIQALIDSAVAAAATRTVPAGEAMERAAAEQASSLVPTKAKRAKGKAKAGARKAAKKK